MSDLQSFQANICFVSIAFVIQEDQILMVKHRKAGIWLAPGGHLEPGELPHIAAEREAFEETGVKVQVFDPYYSYQSQQSEYLPSAFETNLHWVSQENYRRRLADPIKYVPEEIWKKGCEQHLGFLYLARPIGSFKLSENPRETEGIGWFTKDEVMKLDTTDDVRQEVRHAFEVLGASQP